MKYELTLADQDEAHLKWKQAPGNSGQREYLRELRKHPLACAELGRPRGYDDIYMTQVDGTDIVFWLGRGASGYHHRISRYMRLIHVLPEEDTTHD